MNSRISASDVCRPIAGCRVCGDHDLIKFLDLGTMPLVNRYLDANAPPGHELAFPLQILFCRSCSLSQLSVVVDPAVLYSHYDYHSSVSTTFQHHCESMANGLWRDFDLSEEDLVVEIASNDGCLLSKFQTLGCRVLGVE